MRVSQEESGKKRLSIVGNLSNTHSRDLNPEQCVPARPSRVSSRYTDYYPLLALFQELWQGIQGLFRVTLVRTEVLNWPSNLALICVIRFLEILVVDARLIDRFVQILPLPSFRR